MTNEKHKCKRCGKELPADWIASFCSEECDRHHQVATSIRKKALEYARENDDLVYNILTGKKIEQEDNRICPDCGGLIRIRNPTGKCDHLYYPENKPQNQARQKKSMEELSTHDRRKTGSREIAENNQSQEQRQVGSSIVNSPDALRGKTRGRNEISRSANMKCGLCNDELQEPWSIVVVDESPMPCHKECIEDAEAEARMEAGK